MATISYATASGGSGAQAVKAYTLTILDDEDPPKVNFSDGLGGNKTSDTVSETDGSFNINVELTRATEKTVTIPFTFCE